MIERFLRLFPVYRELVATNEELTEQLDRALDSFDRGLAKIAEKEALVAFKDSQISFLTEAYRKIEASRDEAVNARLKSLDLVNTSLLQGLATEQPPKNISDFKAVPKQRQQAISQMRRMERDMMNAAVLPPKKKPAAS